MRSMHPMTQLPNQSASEGLCLTWALLCLLLLPACHITPEVAPPQTICGPETAYDGIDQDCDGKDLIDVDEDGVPGPSRGGQDCNDFAAEVHPGAEELCDRLDNDCDGAVDNPPDQDADGFTGCDVQPDCNDADPSSYPGASDAYCQDGRDQDCDGDDACLGYLSLMHASVQLLGAHEGENLGAKVAYAGDLNGDSKPDIAMTTADRVLLFLGPIHSGKMDTLQPALVIENLPGGLDFARVVSLGDFNGDSQDDLAISSLDAYGGMGAVYLYLSPLELSSPVPTVTLTGEGSLGQLGWFIGAGDLNGDGLQDLVASTTNGARGNLLIVYGSRTSFASKTRLIDEAGMSIEGGELQYFGLMTAVGDLNGDGLADIFSSSEMPGNYWAHGSLFFGPLDHEAVSANDADVTIQGSSAHTLMLYPSIVGNVNGDYNGEHPLAELLLGSPYESPAGRSYLFLGRSHWPESLILEDADVRVDTIDNRPMYFGMSGGAAGDFNGDGFDDWLIGSYLYSTESSYDGTLFLLAGGPDIGLNRAYWYAEDMAVAQFFGSPSSNAGNSVAFVHDVNGDGGDDLLMGAWSTSVEATGQGAGYLLFGNPASIR